MQDNGALVAHVDFAHLFWLVEYEGSGLLYLGKFLVVLLFALWAANQIRYAYDYARELCRPRLRRTSPWERLAYRLQFTAAEERHDSAVAARWTEWNSLGRHIRAVRAALPATEVQALWARWNGLSGHLRTHPWHHRRQARRRG